MSQSIEYTKTSSSAFGGGKLIFNVLAMLVSKIVTTRLSSVKFYMYIESAKSIREDEKNSWILNEYCMQLELSQEYICVL